MPLTSSRTSTRLSISLDGPQPLGTNADPIAQMSPTSLDAQEPTPGFSPTMLVTGPAASPFVFHGSPIDRLRASLCLTAAIYYEAANEPDEGQRAVAQVVLNRVRHPAFPNSICGVVYQGTERSDALCQFTFGCDGSMARLPVNSVWSRARRNAQAALAGAVYAPVGLATHYHTLAVNPVWNRVMTPTAIVGAHIFFRWPGGAGASRAFHVSYRGNEPIPAPKPKTIAPTSLFEVAAIQTVPTGSDIRRATFEPTNAPIADHRYIEGTLPESTVREEYRESGQWKTR